MNKQQEKRDRITIREVKKATGLSGALLTYSLHFGIMGIVEVKKPKKKRK